ncbi:MAG: DNA alkylation repair protein [Calditrichaceae bacterium]|jgi:hypothetical protein
MGYYDLSASGRKNIYEQMKKDIIKDLSFDNFMNIHKYASDPDTYLRKNCYLILSRLYAVDENYKKAIISSIDTLCQSDEEKIRQTAVYTLGEIGKRDFSGIESRLEIFLNDTHSSVRNALTGAIKQMGERNPEPVIKWIKTKIKHCDPEMRMKLLHGLELRGRTHPEEILPLIKDVLNENPDKKIQKMLIHIIGQISYKKGCIEKVTRELKTWDDRDFVADCKKEIINVHKNYEKFSFLNPSEVVKYLSENFQMVI